MMAPPVLQGGVDIYKTELNIWQHCSEKWFLKKCVSGSGLTEEQKNA